MPQVEIKDGLDSSIQLHEFKGQYFPPFPLLDENLRKLPDMPCRDDDVVILTYPKTGTHWIWEIVNLLYTDDGEISRRLLLERDGIDKMTALPSIRKLSTHITPEFYPKDMINRKCKIIWVQRNPKDIYASYFHFIRKLTRYKYDGEWDGFFELTMIGKSPYGSWFDFTKQWEDFFIQHPDIPLLRLYFEDMKMYLSSEIEKIVQFLDLPCTPSYKDRVAGRCGFEEMKNADKKPGELSNRVSRDGKDPLFRKGVVGDWKNHFSVAQSERFDAEYREQMKGLTFKFERYM